MFRVMLFNDRLKEWEPTGWGLPRGATKEDYRDFRGIHTFSEGVAALRDACANYPRLRYRLVHQQ